MLKLRSLSGVFLWLYIWHFCYCILSDVDILIYITIGAKALLTFCSTGCCFFVFIFFTILTTVWEFEYSLFDTEYFFLFDWQTLWAFCSHSGVGYVHTHSSYPITPELCHLHKTTIRKIIICEGTQYQQTTQNKILQSNVIYIYSYYNLTSKVQNCFFFISTSLVTNGNGGSEFLSSFHNKHFFCT